MQLSLVKAIKRSTKKEIKPLETELENIKNRKEYPLSVDDILEDNVISSVFPNICYLLKLFVLVPVSEVVAERGFSKMKLTLPDKPTWLDNKSLDTLMIIQQCNIGTRSSATNSRDMQETPSEINISWGYLLYLGVCFI